MASHTFTNLIPDALEAMDVVSRELVGMIPSVQSSMSGERVALNTNIRSFSTPALTASDVTPSATRPEGQSVTFGNVALAITKARQVDINWNGEQTLANKGTGNFSRMTVDLMSQAMRTLVNEIESDLCSAAALGASRAYGTAGTTPFASDLSDPAQVRKILDDNGAPATGRSFVIDTAAGAKMRTLTNLTKANESGDTSLLRQGVLLDLHGFAIRESAQVKTVTKGTAASATTNAAGYAVGATTITLASAGTGAFIVGDIVTFAGDTNKYLVVTGDTDTSNGGTIVLAAPGLRQAIAASATAITVVNTATRNMAFSRNAIVLATRLPAMPEGGDAAVDESIITDPRTGLSMRFALYKQNHQNAYVFEVAWGQAVIKPEHLALSLG